MADDQLTSGCSCVVPVSQEPPGFADQTRLKPQAYSLCAVLSRSVLSESSIFSRVHFNILGWKIPRKGSGGLHTAQGAHRVGHD